MKKITRGAPVGPAISTGADSGTKFASWKVRDLEAKRSEGGRPWHQFFDNPTMYQGVYSLAVGAADGQEPHKEDEIYYVVAGRANFRAGDEETAVEEGSVLFVKAGVTHRFRSIEEPIELLVFFSKARA